MSWIELTPNTDFDGWSEYSWPPGSPGPLVCPSGLWSVDPDVGSLYCSGAEGHTALLCDRVFADFRFHIEYRFAPQPETDEPRLNSGVYLRMDPPQHVMHQIETRGNNAGFLIGGSVREGRETLIRSLRPGADGWVDGATHRPRDWGPLVSEPDTRPREMCRPDGSDLGEPAPVRIHPSGEWNTYDVEAVGTRITIWTNGVLSCYTDQCDVPSGRIGVEAEYRPIEFREITLRVYAPDTDIKEVESEVYWLDSLNRETNVSVPTPVRGSDGSEVQKIELGSGFRYCTSFSWIEGERLESLDSRARTSKAIASIGEHLAAMHNHAEEVTLPDRFTRPTYGLARIQKALGPNPDERALGLLDRIEQMGEARKVFGLIHHETGSCNIFIHEDSAAFIDFRPFGFGYYFTDIASIHRDLGPGEHKTFLNGYRRVRELTPEDIGLIESFNEIM